MKKELINGKNLNRKKKFLIRIYCIQIYIRLTEAIYIYVNIFMYRCTYLFIYLLLIPLATLDE